MFFIFLLIFVATTVISALLRPKPLGPSALGDFGYPTASAGRAIPVVFGTVKISGGNTVWWGDLHTKPISPGFFGFLTGAGPVGYKYFLGVQYVLCQGPIDDLVGMEADSKGLDYSRAGMDPIITYVSDNNLFGGTPNGQGGLVGNIYLYRGTDTQAGSDYLSQKQNETSLQANPGSLPAFVGYGNGGLSFVAPGPSMIAETITITATGSFYRADSTKPFYNAREFIVEGSVSGRISDENGYDTAFEGFSFGSAFINFTIVGGSTDFAPGDQWTIATLGARVSPAYAGICYAVLQDFYVGVSSSPHAMVFVVRRCPDPLGLGAGIANINGDANPALAVYDWLTNARYGLGILPTRIDPVSFTYAATLLAGEGLGISMLFDSQDTADTQIAEILRHADGVLYVEPTTGLWTIKLARGDYDVATIPDLTADDVESVSMSRASWEETSNQVVLSYVDRAEDFNIRTVKQEDNGNIAITGETRTESVDYHGLSNPATAALICTRYLKGVCYPFSKVTIVVNRKAWSYRISGVFKLTWAPLGIVASVYRIIKIGYGEVASGKITIDAVEDIFGLNATMYTAPPASGWINPTGEPAAAVMAELVEVPFALVPAPAPAGIYAMVLAGRSQGSDSSFQVWQPIGGSDTQTNAEIGSGFSPIGVLQGAYPAATPALDPTGFTIGIGGLDLATLESTSAGGLLQGINLALIDEEIVSWETAVVNEDGTTTISNVIRGCFDTVPAAHASGALVYFFTDGAGLTQPAPYPADLTVQAKILPTNNLGTFPLISASYLTLATRSRYLRPYVPGNISIQGGAYGVRYSLTVGAVVITWSARNRLTQTAAGILTRQDAGDVGALEAGEVYKVTVTIAGVIVRTVEPATTPFTYSGDERAADAGVGPVTLDIYSNANGLDSYDSQELSFEMTGFGLDFGNYFGGIQQ